MTSPLYPVLLASVEVVEGVNDTVVFHDGTADRTATIAPGTYYLRGDYEAGDLAAALEAALDDAPDSALSFAAIWAASYVVEFASRLILNAGSDPWTLKLDGTFDLSLLGFTEQQAAANGSVTSKTPPIAWVSNQPYRTREGTPRRPNVEQHETPSGGVYTFVGADVRTDRRLELAYIAGARARRERSPDDPTASLEAWWELASDGRPVELHLSPPSPGTDLDGFSSATRVCTGVLHVDTCRTCPLALTHLSQALYAGDVRLIETP